MRAAKLKAKEVEAAIAFDQPGLRAAWEAPDIVVQGKFLLLDDGKAFNPAGPISEFDVKIVVNHRYPDLEPKVFETGGRIPRCIDRHINSDGDCCVTVWEEWLVRTDDTSFSAFLNGPVREFFLAQYWFERTGRWPFGERPHGEEGLLEAYADVLGIPNKKKDIIYYLKQLARPRPRGHWPCPCGSGELLRRCHWEKLIELHERVPPRIAKRMLRRLK